VCTDYAGVGRARPSFFHVSKASAGAALRAYTRRAVQGTCAAQIMSFSICIFTFCTCADSSRLSLVKMLAAMTARTQHERPACPPSKGGTYRAGRRCTRARARSCSPRKCTARSARTAGQRAGPRGRGSAHLLLAEERQVQQDLERLRVRGEDDELGDAAVQRLRRCAARQLLCAGRRHGAGSTPSFAPFLSIL
jgi:hypothetical protein